MTTLTITHTGLPMLWVAQASLPTDFHGPFTTELDPDTGRLAVRGPAALYTCPNFPPEVVHHLSGLAGLWLVVTDANGLPIAGAAAPIGGASAARVLSMFPDDARPATPTLSRPDAAAATLGALDDGIYFVHAPAGGDSGHGAPMAIVWHQARQMLRGATNSMLPDGNFLLGFDASRECFDLTGRDVQFAPDLNARLERARNQLAGIAVDGQAVGASLVGVMDMVNMGWSRSAEGRWGWDPTNGILALPAAADPGADVLALTAGLYHAHASVSRQSCVTKAAADALTGASALPSFDSFLTDVAVESAFAARLLIGAAGCIDVDVPGFDAARVAIDEDIVKLQVAPDAKALYDVLDGFQTLWHDISRRMTLPIPAVLPEVDLTPQLQRPAAITQTLPAEISEYRCMLHADPGMPPLYEYVSPVPLATGRLLAPIDLMLDEAAGRGRITMVREDKTAVVATISNRAWLDAVARLGVLTVVCTHPTFPRAARAAEALAGGNVVPPAAKPCINEAHPVTVATGTL
jgi:hypothetical protein